jgi:hypothetical protein
MGGKRSDRVDLVVASSLGAGLMAVVLSAGVVAALGEEVSVAFWALGGVLGGALIGLLVSPPRRGVNESTAARSAAAAVRLAAIDAAERRLAERLEDRSLPETERTALQAQLADVVRAADEVQAGVTGTSGDAVQDAVRLAISAYESGATERRDLFEAASRAARAARGDAVAAGRSVARRQPFDGRVVLAGGLVVCVSSIGSAVALSVVGVARGPQLDIAHALVLIGAVAAGWLLTSVASRPGDGEPSQPSESRSAEPSSSEGPREQQPAAAAAGTAVTGTKQTGDTSTAGVTETSMSRWTRAALVLLGLVLAAGLAWQLVAFVSWTAGISVRLLNGLGVLLLLSAFVILVTGATQKTRRSRLAWFAGTLVMAVLGALCTSAASVAQDQITKRLTGTDCISFEGEVAQIASTETLPVALKAIEGDDRAKTCEKIIKRFATTVVAPPRPGPECVEYLAQLDALLDDEPKAVAENAMNADVRTGSCPAPIGVLARR